MDIYYFTITRKIQINSVLGCYLDNDPGHYAYSTGLEAPKLRSGAEWAAGQDFLFYLLFLPALNSCPALGPIAYRLS